ncbi:RNA polymerase subunit sigma-70 [Taibaiella sp. KBW10]|nr:RNA polymerase subunit sigma-70 [Taibaiella sp. KBW10]
MLTKWITTRGGAENDAYDIFQEGLMVLYEKAKNPDFILTCKLSTYLFAVCKRLWFKKMDVSSQTSYLQEMEQEEDDTISEAQYSDDVEQHLEKEFNFNLLDASMDQLGEPCSSLLKAFYIEEKNMQEIAKQFGYTNAENAKTQKYKCLNRLKKLFFSSKKAN